jgi:hypothetical protein
VNREPAPLRHLQLYATFGDLHDVGSSPINVASYKKGTLAKTGVLFSFFAVSVQTMHSARAAPKN